ncbi:hypothetical protein MA16_Dca002332 [Dendrobium catenatum]|uniref:Uncharacterized protein n=1 Tax=Dendrobium catenatum TaxID=906689 RepID=A0A2I0W071_9ASPA|nr:hypothetical protein MA16_Dca002332 [Dendrobium catenatum]
MATSFASNQIAGLKDQIEGSKLLSIRWEAPVGRDGIHARRRMDDRSLGQELPQSGSWLWKRARREAGCRYWDLKRTGDKDAKAEFKPDRKSRSGIFFTGFEQNR